jgi:hypothetical protein
MWAGAISWAAKSTSVWANKDLRPYSGGGKKIIFWRLIGLICALVLLQAEGSLAASANQTLNVSAQDNSRAKIVLNVGAINFVDFSNDNLNNLPANENPVAITVKVKTGNNRPITLTFLASDDLRSPTRTIPISNVTWTATGAGYQSGTMSKTSAQTVGTWTGPGSYAGALSFFFDTKVPQAAASYTSSGTFTLTAP